MPFAPQNLRCTEALIRRLELLDVLANRQQIECQYSCLRRGSRIDFLREGGLQQERSLCQGFMLAISPAQ